MGSRGGVRAPTPPAVDPSTMGPMPRATTRRHPPDQLIHAIRAALLSTIQAKCPEVLDDLRDAVFTPLIHSMTRDDIVALLIVDRASSCVASGGSLPHRPSRRKSWPRRRPCSSHYQGDHAPAGAIGRCGECAGENGALSRRSSAPGSRLPHQAREELERASRGLREPPKAHHPSVTGTAAA